MSTPEDPQQPKMIDLSILSDEDKLSIDALVKKLVEREKFRLDSTDHASDHRSNHNSQP